MKVSVKHIFIILLLLITPVLKAQNTSINFIENDYKKALEQSKASQKTIFIMVYATWCSHCNKMKSTVLKEPSVITFFNNNFINLMIDSEMPAGKEFMKKYSIKSFPVFLFLDEKETHLYSTGGEFTTEEFLAEAQKALNPNTQLPYLEKKFNEDVANPENCIIYLNALRKSIDSDKSDEVTAKYLATQSKDQLITPINWKIVAYGVNNLDSKGFETIVNHQTDFAKVSSAKRVEAKIINVVKDVLKDASSAAIYGARGANGVVIITTKKGKEGKGTFSINLSQGVSEPTHKRKWLNSQQYVALLQEAGRNVDDLESVEDELEYLSQGTDWRNGEVNTDWQNEALRSGSTTDADFSVSGGDDKTKYYFSGAYNNTVGIVDSNNLERITARTNVSHNVSDRLMVE